MPYKSRRRLSSHMKKLRSDPAFEKKRAAGVRKYFADRRKYLAAQVAAADAAAIATVNGHDAPAIISDPSPIRMSGKKLARETLTDLAIEGARVRLARLEQDCERLRIFLKGATD